MRSLLYRLHHFTQQTSHIPLAGTARGTPAMISGTARDKRRTGCLHMPDEDSILLSLHGQSPNQIKSKIIGGEGREARGGEGRVASRPSKSFSRPLEYSCCPRLSTKNSAKPRVPPVFRQNSIILSSVVYNKQRQAKRSTSTLAKLKEPTGPLAKC